MLQLRDVFIIHWERPTHVIDFAHFSVKVLLDSNTVTNEPGDFVLQ